MTGGDEGRGMRGGDEGVTQLKTKVISAAAQRKQCLLLGEACLAACSRGWVQGASRNDLAPERSLFVFSPNSEALSLLREGDTKSCGYCKVNSSLSDFSVSFQVQYVFLVIVFA